MMQKAIREARKSKPEDSRDHPLVGAVVVTAGGKITSGYRGEIEPGEHAEFTVLEKKFGDEALSGSTVYATLEPCTVRNPPKVSCADRLIERRVKRVYIGMLDPDSRICGRGVRRLRDAGIEIQFFPKKLMAELEDLNRHFIRSKIAQRITGPETVSPSQEEALSPEGWEDLAIAYARRGESRKAVDSGLRALQHYSQHKMDKKTIKTSLFLAQQYRHQGLFNDSLRYYASAEERLRSVGAKSPEEEMRLLRIRAGRTMVEKFLLQGDCRSALRDYEAIGTDLKELQARAAPADSTALDIETYYLHWHRQKAEMLRQLGFYERAESSFHKIFSDLGYVEVAAKAWSLLGEAESSRMLGAFSRSKRSYDGAELYARKNMDFRLLARVLRNRAELARTQGLEVSHYLEELEELSHNANYLYGRIYRRLIDGGLHLSKGEILFARSAFLEARSLCRSNGVPSGIETVHSALGLGESYRLDGDRNEASALLRNAASSYRKQGIAWGYLRAAASLAECQGKEIKLAKSWSRRADWAFESILRHKQESNNLPSVFENIL